MSRFRPIASGSLREISAGVFYTDIAPDSIFFADQDVIAFLKEKATASPTRRARICAHSDPQAEQHDMLIASDHATYVAPHRHPSKSESFLVLEGLADVLLFNDDGSVKKVISMGPLGSGRPFFYRMPARQFHALTVTSDMVVFVESTKGPFDDKQTEFAVWAPVAEQVEEGRAYLAAIVKRS
jgi:cupin fold WbuC family metalloprotein